MKYIFIVNPIAGNDNQKKIFSYIKSGFRLSDDEMIVEETHARGDAKKIAEFYAKNEGDNCIVVACGGDGTVHEIANGLACTSTPMMILPFGTGNDFAKKIYGTKKVNCEQVIQDFGLYDGKFNYDIKPIDLLDYNGEICINVMSFGLDTMVETIGRKMAAKAPFLGHNAYNLAVLPVLLKPLHYNISYELNCVDKATGEEYIMSADDRDYALFALCNASYYGGGFCPAPDSVLDDGLLDITIIDGLSLKDALPLVPKYSKGQVNAETSEYCTNAFAKSGRVWMKDGSALLGNCDGENFDYSEVNFAVKEKALKLCFPKQ